MKQGMLDAKDEEPEFTEEVVNSLFSNVDDLREVHLRIVDDLSASVTADYDAGSELGKLYMNHVSAITFREKHCTAQHCHATWHC